MLSIPEAGAERNKCSSEASVKRSVMLSDSEASRNQGKEPSPYGLPIAADSSLPLRITRFLFLSNIRI
jgi:hypothetical protein